EEWPLLRRDLPLAFGQFAGLLAQRAERFRLAKRYGQHVFVKRVGHRRRTNEAAHRVFLIGRFGVFINRIPFHLAARRSAMFAHRIAATLVVLLGAGVAAAQNGPQLVTVFPPGAKAGATVEVSFSGSDFTGDEKLLFSGEGF